MSDNEKTRDNRPREVIAYEKLRRFHVFFTSMTPFLQSWNQYESSTRSLGWDIEYFDEMEKTRPETYLKHRESRKEYLRTRAAEAMASYWEFRAALQTVGAMCVEFEKVEQDIDPDKAPAPKAIYEKTALDVIKAEMLKKAAAQDVGGSR